MDSKRNSSLAGNITNPRSKNDTRTSNQEHAISSTITDLLIEEYLDEITYSGGDDDSRSGVGLGTYQGGGNDNDATGPAKQGARFQTGMFTCPQCHSPTSLGLNTTTRQCSNCFTTYPAQDMGSVGVKNSATMGYVKVPAAPFSTNEKETTPRVGVRYLGNQLFELAYGPNKTQHSIENAHSAIKFQLSDAGHNYHYLMHDIIEWLFSAKSGESLSLDVASRRRTHFNADGFRIHGNGHS